MEEKAYPSAQLARDTRIGLNSTVAREKAAIESIIEQQDISLNIMSDIVDDLFAKFAPVLSQQEQVGREPGADVASYGSSQVYHRLLDQWTRTNNISEKLRLLRGLAEV